MIHRTHSLIVRHYSRYVRLSLIPYTPVRHVSVLSNIKKALDDAMTVSDEVSKLKIDGSDNSPRPTNASSPIEEHIQRFKLHLEDDLASIEIRNKERKKNEIHRIGQKPKNTEKVRKELIDIPMIINELIDTERQAYMLSLGPNPMAESVDLGMKQKVQEYEAKIKRFENIASLLNELAELSSFTDSSLKSQNNHRIFKREVISSHVPKLAEKDFESPKTFEDLIRRLAFTKFIGNSPKVLAILHHLMHSSDPEIASLRTLKSYYYCVHKFASRQDFVSVGRLLYQMQSFDNINPDTRILNIVLQEFVILSQDERSQFNMVETTLKYLKTFGLQADLTTWLLVLLVVPEDTGLKRVIYNFLMKNNVTGSTSVLHNEYLNTMMKEGHSSQTLIQYFNKINKGHIGVHGYNTVLKKLLDENNFLGAWNFVEQQLARGLHPEVSTLRIFQNYARSKDNFRLMLYVTNTLTSRFKLYDAHCFSYAIKYLAYMPEFPSYWKLMVNFFINRDFQTATGQARRHKKEQLIEKVAEIGKQHGISVNLSKDQHFRLFTQIKRLYITNENIQEVLSTPNSDCKWIDEILDEYDRKFPQYKVKETV